jgi:undecaprenyl pyrophosphate phosphatase UppP
MTKPVRLPDPEPLETNDVLAVAVGTGAWVVALVVLLFLHHTLERHHTTWWYWVCLTGIALGCAGLFVTIRQRKRH